MPPTNTLNRYRGTHQPQRLGLIVAGSNATVQERATADYACDGTADEVEINAALTALPSIGGTVRLVGSFTVAAQIITAKANSRLIGEGQAGAKLTVVNSGGSPVNTDMVKLAHAACEVRDLTVDGNKANNAGATSMRGVYAIATGCSIINVTVTNCAGSGATSGGISTSNASSDCLVDHCTVSSGAGPGFSIDCGDSSKWTRVRDCTSLSNGGTGFTSLTASIAVENCIAASNTIGLQCVSGTGGLSVIGGTYRNNAGSGLRVQCDPGLISGVIVTHNAANGIDAGADENPVAVVGCTIDRNTLIGVILTGAGSMIAGCEVILSGTVGISLNGEVACVGNTVRRNSQTTDITYANILVTGTGSLIVGNKIRAGSGAKRAAYGIQIASGTGTIVRANDNLGGGITSDLLDGGTGTINDFTTPMTTLGDIIVGSTGGAASRMAKGPINTVFGVDAAGTLGYMPGGVGSAHVLQLNYAASTDVMNGAAITANTWTDIDTNKTFTVDQATSVVEISVGGNIQMGGGSIVAGSVCSSRIVVDSAGANTPYRLGGDAIQTAGNIVNALAGSPVVSITGLAAGTHTVKLQIRASAAALAYLRAASFPDLEALTIRVHENKQGIGLKGDAGVGGGGKRQLNYAAVADIWNGTPPASGTSDIISNQPFTVDDATSLIEIIVDGGAQVTTTVGTPCGTQILLDNATAIPLGSANQQDTAGLVNPFTGATSIWTTLTAGAHNIRVRFNSFAAPTTAFLRPSTNPTYEHLKVTVIEHKPGGLGWVYKGTWSSAVTYGVNEIVSLGGVVYIAIQGGVNQPPATSPLYWSVLVSAGSMTNPMTTTDDIIVGGGSGAPLRMAKGSASTVLSVSAAGVLGFAQVARAMLAAGAVANYQLSGGWGGSGNGAVLGGAAVSFVSNGDPIFAFWQSTIRSEVLGAIMGVGVQRDSAVNYGFLSAGQLSPASGQVTVSGFTVITGVAAGSHTYRPYITANAGTPVVDNNGLMLLLELR